jgi:hypothetical protein
MKKSRTKRAHKPKAPPGAGAAPQPARAAEPRKTGDGLLKIRLRGKDGAALSMKELQQGLFEAAKKLIAHPCRAKSATIYLMLVDGNGEPAQIEGKGEWTIYPYASAADEHGA